MKNYMDLESRVEIGSFFQANAFDLVKQIRGGVHYFMPDQIALPSPSNNNACHDRPCLPYQIMPYETKTCHT